LAALAIGAALLFAGADEARAFVRSTTGNMPFFWRESCVPVTIYLNRFPDVSGMSADQVVKSVTAAAHAWSSDAVTCPRDGSSPYLEIVPTLAPASTTPPVVAWDAKNSIIFRTELWSKSGKPGHDYAFEALAVTTVTARSDGHIVDADMEVNGVTQSWLNFDPGVSVPFQQGDTKSYYDLQNALTHEFGHLIGLDHTCFTPSVDNPLVDANGKLRPKDNNNNFIPDCGLGSPEIVRETVMYNVTDAGETSKRTLSGDDIDAVCTIYAPSVPHDACALDSATPGCAVAPTRPERRAGWAWGLSAGLLGVVAFAARRRARRG
jgi:hypothetical protein